MSTLANIIWILTYSLISIGLAMLLYPLYIKLLRKLKAGKTIRENNATGEKSEIFAKLHSHKAGTPTMGWGLFMVIMLIMIWLSFILQKKGIITYSLRNSKETYIILFGFFSMWLIWLVDDWLNIKNFWKIKWLSAKAKMTGMILFSAFISYWFYVKLGIDYINLRPLWWKIEIWIFFPILTFLTTIGIVNAINITDGLPLMPWYLNLPQWNLYRDHNYLYSHFSFGSFPLLQYQPSKSLYGWQLSFRTGRNCCITPLPAQYEILNYYSLHHNFLSFHLRIPLKRAPNLLEKNPQKKALRSSTFSSSAWIQGNAGVYNCNENLAYPSNPRYYLSYFHPCAILNS